MKTFFSYMNGAMGCSHFHFLRRAGKVQYNEESRLLTNIAGIAIRLESDYICYFLDRIYHPRNSEIYLAYNDPQNKDIAHQIFVREEKIIEFLKNKDNFTNNYNPLDNYKHGLNYKNRREQIISTMNLINNKIIDE